MKGNEGCDGGLMSQGEKIFLKNAFYGNFSSDIHYNSRL